MNRLAVLLAFLSLASCSKDSGLPGDKDMGPTFDPCRPDPQPGYDPSSKGLKACCDTGPAHCVPSKDVIPALTAQLDPCDETQSVCMPDPIIKGGGTYVPPSCTSSVGNAPGVCLSTCIPLVADNPQTALLGQDGCGEGELCIPCKNPLSGEPTGACELNMLLCAAADGGSGDGGGDGGGGNCPHQGPPIIDPAGFAACDPACGGAHCIPANLVSAAQQSLLAKCTSNGNQPGFCAPDRLIETGGNFVPKECTSVGGSEGRCLSTCLPDVAERAALLPNDVCEINEKCVPCYDPTSTDPMASTGACSLACDAPKKPPLVLTCPWTGPALVEPTSFPACDPSCYGAHCVPSILVPTAQQALLLTCPGGFCTPDSLIASAGNVIPKKCSSVAGAEGRCLSTCVPLIAAQAALLPTDVCDMGEKCAPCFDPTAGDPTVPTGACSLGCDMPTEPPLILSCPWMGPDLIDPALFGDCDPVCAGAHCLPAAQVPSDLQSLLAPCPGGFCAPDDFIRSGGKMVPAECRSIAGVEGRCLSTCLPDIAAQSAVLPSTGCGTNERCAPCFNPTDPTPQPATGACTIACDMPKEPPVDLMCPWTGNPILQPTAFPACSPACGGAHCLPADLVPDAQRALFASCPSTGGAPGVCAPDAIIRTAGNTKPTTCRSVAGVEGRCLSTCLPDVASQPLLPSVGCAASERCVPCYNPLDDPLTPTGACSTSKCDAPVEAPVNFPAICPWTGPDVLDPTRLRACSPACGGAHCMPAEFVPVAQQGLLAACDADAAPGTQPGFCTPDLLIRTGGKPNMDAPGRECRSVAGVEGRCLSTCLPLVAQNLLILPQGTCTSAERCVPCYDPTSAQPTVQTGACSLGCDAPEEGPTLLTCPWNGPAVLNPAVLPGCNPICSGAHCLPNAYVPAGQASQLATCGSGATAGRCTPDTLITTGGNVDPPNCVPWVGTGAGSFRGRCLSTCLPAVSSQPTLEQSSCVAGTRCVPCHHPISGVSTGACGTVGCDDQPAATGYLWPRCCDPTGVCVPSSQLTQSQRDALGQRDCPDTTAGYYCAPLDQIPGSGYVTRSCSVSFSVIPPFSWSGVCVPDCIIGGLSTFIPRDGCPTGWSCPPP